MEASLVKGNWRERIAPLSAAKTNYDPVSTIRNLGLQGFPFFNIRDSISFIYRLCIGDIKTRLGVERHLSQFRSRQRQLLIPELSDTEDGQLILLPCYIFSKRLFGFCGIPIGRELRFQHLWQF